jgi:hypothetical protein
MPFLPLDPAYGMGKNQDPDPGSRMNLPESLETIFWVKNFKFYDAEPCPGAGVILTRDPGSGKIRIRDTG